MGFASQAGTCVLIIVTPTLLSACAGHDRVSGPTDPGVMVLLISGQSNSANSGQGKGPINPAVLNWSDGLFTVATDPLRGATGTDGSIWTRLGDSLIANHLAAAVILAPVSIGSTAIASWAHDSATGQRLRSTATSLIGLGLAPTHVLWVQGESDNFNGTDSATYDRALRNIVRDLRSVGVTAPFYAGLSTHCAGLGPSHPVRAAITAVAATEPNVVLGADTDVLSDAYRYDRCHLTSTGLANAAALWLSVLRRH